MGNGQIPSDGEVSEETLLEQIHFVRFGVPLDEARKRRFFNDLSVYSRALQREGKPTVSIPAVRSWLSKKPQVSKPRRAGAMIFLHGYLLWISNRGLVPEGPRRALFEEIHLFLRRYTDSAGINAMLPAHGKPGFDPLVMLTIQSLVASASRVAHSELHDLFRGGDDEDETDQSYYLLYRHSTNRGAIMKSFVVLQRPLKNRRSQYVFNNFIWSGTRPEYPRYIYRESEGFVLKMEKSYYLAGYTFTVPVDKRTAPEEYRRLRPAYKEKPTGLETIAIEYDDIRFRPGLLSCLIMTIAGNQQPVVARAALLHLGTKSSLGMMVWDSMVNPMEMHPNDLETDIIQVVDSLRGPFFRNFGSYLEQYVASGEWERRGGKEIKKVVLELIDNTPAWERVSKSRRRTTAQGAIETDGVDPASRPRE